MKSQFLSLSVLASLITSTMALANPQLPTCTGEVSNQRARYALGIDFGAQLAARYADTETSQVSDMVICNVIGGTSTDLQALLSIGKISGLQPTLEQAGRLIEAQTYADGITGFCLSFPTGGIASVSTSDRTQLKKVATALADVAQQILTVDVGCAPQLGAADTK